MHAAQRLSVIAQYAGYYPPVIPMLDALLLFFSFLPLIVVM